MSIGDLLIIYLSFGAPVAVYEYLQIRHTESRRRIALSLLTFLFWIPAVVRLGHRYLTNAYFSDDFVSHESLDAPEVRLADLRERIRSELIKAEFGSLPSYLVQEVVDRYVGLGNEIDKCRSQTVGLSSDLFEAAGRIDSELATVCLMRRNRRRIERHHTKARRDFVALFERASERSPGTALPAIQLAIELSIHLDDRKAVDGLQVISEQIRDEVWNPNGQRIQVSKIPAVASSLAMKTASLNND